MNEIPRSLGRHTAVPPVLRHRKPAGLATFIEQTTRLNGLLAQDPATISDPSRHRAALRDVLDDLGALGTGFDARCYLAAEDLLASMRTRLDAPDFPDGDITDPRWHQYLDLVRALRPTGIDVYASLLELRYPSRAARSLRVIPSLPDFPSIVADALRNTPEDDLSAEPLDRRGASDRLVAVTARLLPPEERPRYVEEFRANLVGLTRWERLRYALSLLRGALQLRKAIVETSEFRSTLQSDQEED